MVVALAKIAGVMKIFGTCSARNIDSTRAAGVTAIDYAAERGRWHETVKTLNGGRGVDLVFDHVMSGGYLQLGLAALAPGGKYIAYGLTDTAAAGQINMLSAVRVFSSLALQQSIWRCFDGKEAAFFNVAGMRDAHNDWYAADLAALVELVRSGQLRPTEGTREWPMSEAPQALMAIAKNEHRGKQVIRVQ